MQIEIDAGGVPLAGSLRMPAGARGLVVVAHGAGSGRWSPRNVAVASRLARAGFGSLLLDLLTAEEAEVDAATGAFRTDVGLVAERLVAAIGWLDRRPDGGPSPSALPLGLYGASVGAAGALAAAAARPDRVAAVVCRGGRVDLAARWLHLVRAPTLLVVGARDAPVLAVNEAVLGRLPAPAELVLVPGAGHLFAEPRALDTVAALTVEWCDRHLRRGMAGDTAAPARG